MFEYHEFDPDGDVVLLLGRQHDGEDTLETAGANADGQNQAEANAVEEIASNGENVPSSKDNIAPKQVRMRVSSKHLMLASSVFRAMFQGEFKEGNALRSTGSVEKELHDDHPEALLILMDIIHGRTRRVIPSKPVKPMAIT
jgi:hypothetical protein